METIDLSDFFNTKPQAEDFSERLSLVNKKIFETGFNPETALLEQFGIEKKDKFMVMLRNNNVNAGSRMAIKQFIEIILSQIGAMPVLSITLAFEPTEKTLQNLSRWFLLTFNKQMLFDIKVDISLIGGAAIMSNGKYMDFSIRPNFDKVFNGMFPKPVAQKTNSKKQ